MRRFSQLQREKPLHWNWRDIRAFSPDYHYEIELPPGIYPIESIQVLPDNNSYPAVVACFRSTTAPLIEIEVVAFRILREIAPADLLEPLLRDRIILEKDRIKSDYGDLLTAVTRGAPGAPYISIWRTFKRGGSLGGLLFCIEARTSEMDYPHVRPVLLHSLASFKLLAHDSWPFFEQLTLLDGTTPNDFALYLPESWQLQVVQNGQSEPFIANLWQIFGGHLVGKITVISALYRGSVQDVIELFSKQFPESDVRIQWQRRMPVLTFGGLERCWEIFGRAFHQNIRVEADIHVYIGIKRGAIFLIGVSGIPKDVDAIASAINERALEIACQTFCAK